MVERRGFVIYPDYNNNQSRISNHSENTLLINEKKETSSQLLSSSQRSITSIDVENAKERYHKTNNINSLFTLAHKSIKKVAKEPRNNLPISSFTSGKFKSITLKDTKRAGPLQSIQNIIYNCKGYPHSVFMAKQLERKEPTTIRDGIAILDSKNGIGSKIIKAKFRKSHFKLGSVTRKYELFPLQDLEQNKPSALLQSLQKSLCDLDTSLKTLSYHSYDTLLTVTSFEMLSDHEIKINSVKNYTAGFTTDVTMLLHSKISLNVPLPNNLHKDYKLALDSKVYLELAPNVKWYLVWKFI
ncbi:Vpr1p NDAI_0F00270 [Naumovozyma dairenensis CBS 421]|uniref:Uncharacterized protein n=1 Tax=Naumovozyma dairenensis (strain ATCC 10597 / BCRC 20456 / CBS 421 / NBRC 0211 / NRRL Y-12639) TaxID=1071378 RepID=G0WC35_NAUDC|nr:hypothetical protein NDAI_0F00270 [Naumovozyma dairenensis CBS 421]CCD25346.1 hypothetical protein NDAI_0F00270 [Naumovozyma dairenensis CBS 421]